MEPERRIKILNIVVDKAKQFEGFRAKPYRCPAGACTIGYGCNLDEHREFIPASVREKALGLHGADLCALLLNAGVMWSRREAEAVLRKQVEGALDDVLWLWAWTGNTLWLDDIRLAVVVDMCFNMGIARLSKFIRFFSALYDRDFDRAADEMVDSRWYGQTGHRAQVLVDEMRQGARGLA